MARRPRRQDTIHHIDAEPGVLNDLLRRAHAHQIARLVGGKVLEGSFNNFAGTLPGLTDAKPANSVAGEPDLNSPLGGFFAKFQIHAALNDAEEGLCKEWSGQWPGQRTELPALRVVIAERRRGVLVSEN